jgi:hypothetical protein
VRDDLLHLDRLGLPLVEVPDVGVDVAGELRRDIHGAAVDQFLGEPVDLGAAVRGLVPVGVRRLLERGDDGFAAHGLHLDEAVEVVGGVLGDGADAPRLECLLAGAVADEGGDPVSLDPVDLVVVAAAGVDALDAHLATSPVGRIRTQPQARTMQRSPSWMNLTCLQRHSSAACR